MITFESFCALFDLDVSSPDSCVQYSQDPEARAVQMAIVGKDNSDEVYA